MLSKILDPIGREKAFNKTRFFQDKQINTAMAARQMGLFVYGKNE